MTRRVQIFLSILLLCFSVTPARAGAIRGEAAGWGPWFIGYDA